MCLAVYYQHGARRGAYAKTRCKSATTRSRIKFTRKRRPSPCHELATNSRDCNIAGPSNCGAGARPIFSEAIREGETSADRIVVLAERGIRGWARGPKRERKGMSQGMRRQGRKAHIRLSRTRHEGEGSMACPP